LALFNVATALLPGVSGFGAKVTVVPAGTPAVAVNTIGVLKVPVTVVGIVTVGSGTAGQATVVGAVAVNAKSFGGTVIVKLVFEISKKILPIDSTLILAVVVGVFGNTKASVPSFGVLAASTVGNV